MHYRKSFPAFVLFEFIFASEFMMVSKQARKTLYKVGSN